LDLGSASVAVNFYQATRFHTKEDQHLKNYFNLYVVVEVRLQVFRYLVRYAYEIGSLVKCTRIFRRV